MNLKSLRHLIKDKFVFPALLVPEFRPFDFEIPRFCSSLPGICSTGFFLSGPILPISSPVFIAVPVRQALKSDTLPRLNSPHIICMPRSPNSGLGSFSTSGILRPWFVGARESFPYSIVQRDHLRQILVPPIESHLPRLKSVSSGIGQEMYGERNSPVAPGDKQRDVHGPADSLAVIAGSSPPRPEPTHP